MPHTLTHHDDHALHAHVQAAVAEDALQLQDGVLPPGINPEDVEYEYVYVYEDEYGEYHEIPDTALPPTVLQQSPAIQVRITVQVILQFCLSHVFLLVSKSYWKKAFLLYIIYTEGRCDQPDEGQVYVRINAKIVSK